MSSNKGSRKKPSKDLSSADGEQNASPSTSSLQRGSSDIRGLQHNSTIAASQFRRRYKLWWRDSMAISNGGSAGHPDPSTLEDQFAKLQIALPGYRLHEGDHNAHLNIFKGEKGTTNEEGSQVRSGGLKDESNEAESGIQHHSLIVRLPIAVDPNVLEKGSRAIRSFTHRNSDMASTLGRHIFIEAESAASQVGLTTAAARRYQRGKCGNKPTTAFGSAEVSKVGWNATISPQIPVQEADVGKNTAVAHQGAANETDSHGQSASELSACEVVLGTTKLLENILIHLPPNKILVCQRVCRTFKNCYESSKQLQLKTFEQVSQVIANGVPNYDIHHGVPQLPFAMNPTFFTQAPRPLAGFPRRLVYKMEAPTGIDAATFVIDSGLPPGMSIQFNHYRNDPSWNSPHTGSWTKQYLTDNSYGMHVVVLFSDHKFYKQGRLMTKKTATVTWSQATGNMGYILSVCKIINWQLIDCLFFLPDSTNDLRTLILAHLLARGRTGDYSKYAALLPSLKCTITTEQLPKKLN